MKLTHSHNIEHWDAEDIQAWQAGGAAIARRNLICSIFAEHVGFSVWSIWSVMVLFMPQSTYHIDAAGKFYLVAMPSLVGAVLRFPYTVAAARFGGRNWTVFNACLLLIPALLTLFFINRPGTSYLTFLVVAAAAGIGGGNFASSMTNINAFYPQRLKGWALGLNAGGGNIGVAVIQLVSLLVIATLGIGQPSVVCAIYLVLIAAAAVVAALGMDNLSHQPASLRNMVKVMAFRDCWVVGLLYVGTFGSFIGYSFAFGQVLQIDFLARLTHGHRPTTAQLGAAALHAAQLAFLGPLLGSLARPYGGRLADRIGGARITLCCFAGMLAATAMLAVAGLRNDQHGGAAGGSEMATYVVGFILLFVLSGLGNGSIYKMIPSIFEAKSHDLVADSAERAAWSRSMSNALIGFAAGVGTLGGVLINVVLRQSYAAKAHSATEAFWAFLSLYALCAAATWAMFRRVRTRDGRCAIPGPRLEPTGAR